MRLSGTNNDNSARYYLTHCVVSCRVVVKTVLLIWQRSQKTAADCNKTKDRWCSCVTRRFQKRLQGRVASFFVECLLPRLVSSPVSSSTPPLASYVGGIARGSHHEIGGSSKFLVFCWLPWHHVTLLWSPFHSPYRLVVIMLVNLAVVFPARLICEK